MPVLRPNWKVDNPNNSSNIFTTRLPQKLYGVPGGGTKSVDIVSNIQTGNIDFYRVNLLGGRESRPFVSYNASTDIPEIKDLNLFGEFYDTRDGQTQFRNLVTGSKTATLDIAKLNTGVDPVSNQNYNNLVTKKGYSSLSQQASAKPGGAAPGALTPPNPDPAAAQPTSAVGTDPDIPDNQGSQLTLSQVSVAQVRNDAGAFNQAAPKSSTGSDGSGGDLRYPLKQNGDYDYLRIGVAEYGRDGFNQSTVSPSTWIILPMQPGLSDTNGTSWNEDTMNILQQKFGESAYSAIKAANTGGLKTALDTLGNGLIDTANQLMNEPLMSSFIAAYFASQAVGTNLLGRSGLAINNNLELLFNGPKLRSFRYSYRLTPREKAEANVIKEIIRILKKGMAPKRSPGDAFLIPPNVFKLEYYQGTGRHPFLNEIKPCALTDMSVNYTPDGTYMTYEDGGSLTSYQLDLQFSELEPIYRDDQERAGGMGY